MIPISHSATLKTIAELEAKLIPSGILFLLIENRTIKWKVASGKFDMEVFKVGSDVSEASTAVKAMKAGKFITENVPREKYGRRLSTVAIPLTDEVGVVVGAFSIVLPRLHPVAESFDDFAPIITELFPEGAFLYISDLTKIAYTQASKKFTLKNMTVGYELKETDIASITIKTGKPQVREIDAERYGIPVSVVNYPLYDEEDHKSIVATLGVVIPRETAGKLKLMSENLSDSLTAISQTIEDLASKSSGIHDNEQVLYDNIHTVNETLTEINSITDFISEVSNQSNMLGLNAAIEASRAGEMGRGFSVVANEIRKLATQTRDTVPKIKELTDAIQIMAKQIDGRSKDSLIASEEQVTATEEISASVEELSAITQELSNISKNL